MPGTYNLSPDTEDQKVAERVIRSGEYDLIVNVIDATNLSRNLYLTMDLLERTNQIIVLLNMLDVAEKEGIKIDIDRLSADLGVPVIPVIGVNKASVRRAVKKIEEAIEHLPEHDSHVSTQEVMDTVQKYSNIDEIYSRVAREIKDRVHQFHKPGRQYRDEPFCGDPHIYGIDVRDLLVRNWLRIGVHRFF